VVETERQAAEAAFVGSPSFRINGRDLFPCPAHRAWCAGPKRAWPAYQAGPSRGTARVADQTGHSAQRRRTGCVGIRHRVPTDVTAHVEPDAVAESGADAVVEVFWRPGCPYCSALRRELTRHAVPSTWRNIWDDDQARAFVRTVNGGSETVPTVRIGEQTFINPRWSRIEPLLGDSPRRSLAPWARDSWPVRRVAAWLAVLALVMLSDVVAYVGHSGISWGIDALAVAAWSFMRPLRR
jgi:mycoredoxin